MTTALLVVPPLVKYAAGPLLGPAMLAGAATAAGHVAHVLDLNIIYLRERLPGQAAEPSEGLAGDHDKPRTALGAIEADFHRRLEWLLPVTSASSRVGDPVGAMCFDHDAVDRAAVTLASGAAGSWVGDRLGSVDRPDVIGVSLLFGGQLLWALATSIVAKRLWPDVPVVWGGPHVTALRNVLTADARHGTFVDGFVFGYAETTFAAMLDAIRDGLSIDRYLVRAGSGATTSADGDASVTPRFDRLGLYGVPRLTLPAQTSRGCAYGRCTFCTYPAIEGSYRAEDLASTEPIIRLAERLGAVVAFKDSLVLPDRLRELAKMIAGRVRWSACTKLHVALDARFMQSLADAGCDTLEFGLETLEPGSQALIQKRQTETLLRQVVEAAATANIGLVVNYMTGFPGENRHDAEERRTHVKELLHGSGVRHHFEHNEFQLERLAPMGEAPERYGTRVIGQWPWSSVLDWDPVEASHRAESGQPRRLKLVA